VGGAAGKFVTNVAMAAIDDRINHGTFDKDGNFVEHDEVRNWLSFFISIFLLPICNSELIFSRVSL
jgi:hypothetical protein